VLLNTTVRFRSAPFSAFLAGLQGTDSMHLLNTIKRFYTSVISQSHFHITLLASAKPSSLTSIFFVLQNSHSWMQRF
jgi:hypothetical protein